MHRLCALLVIVLAYSYAPCQQSSDKEDSPTCCYSELYRKEGWVIPGVKDAIDNHRRAAHIKFPAKLN